MRDNPEIIKKMQNEESDETIKAILKMILDEAQKDPDQIRAAGGVGATREEGLKLDISRCQLSIKARYNEGCLWHPPNTSPRQGERGCTFLV